jgi:hypothetical protein
MDNDLFELQNQWQKAKGKLKPKGGAISELYSKIKEKEKSNYFFYYGTISILSLTLIGISLFFYYVAPVQETLSRIGVGQMILGLLIRIIIEVGSIRRAKNINHSDGALKTLENTYAFHSYRKMIHHVVAPTIITCYTLGFYMITPEFTKYIPLPYLIMIDVSYVVVGIILFLVIRKGVRKEMRYLNELSQLREELVAE